jgi:two-component system NtrC family sensor kinase
MIDPKTKELIQFFEAMVDGVYVIDENFVVEYMNDAMVKSFGEGVGRKCHELLLKKDKLCSWCRAKEVFSGESIRWEHRIERLDRTYDLFEFPLKNTDGSMSKVSIFRDITEEKRIKERLRATKEDYRRLFENARSGLYVSSREGRFLDANPALLEMLGYESKEEFLGLDIRRDLYVQPEDRRKFQTMIERNGYVMDYEVNFKRKDGSPIPVLLTSHVRFDQDGKVLGYEGIIVDQSQRKEIEEDYRRLFENVDCGVYVSTKEGKFVNANQAMLNMLGYESKEEFLKIDITGDLYVNAEDRKRFEKMIERHGRVIDLEVMFKRKDGTSVPVLHTARARYDRQGKVIGYEGINVDLSHRKRIEGELREAHDFLDKVIKSSPNAIIAADMDGNIFIWNKAAEDTLGYTADQVIGKMNIEKI